MKPIQSHRRLPALLSLFGLALCASACAQPPEDDVEVAESALGSVNRGAAWVRTPSSVGLATEKPLSCADCSYNSTSSSTTPARNSWSNASVGVYLVRLKNMAPSPTSRTIIHVSAFGNATPVCNVDRAATVASGQDMLVGVRCHDSISTTANSRFTLTYWAVPGGAASGSEDRGFAQVVGNQLVAGGTYSNSAQAPTLGKIATGRYLITFPGLTQTSPKRGNAQVTSWSPTANCSLDSWNTDSRGTFVQASCYTPSGAFTDADLSISYTQSTIADVEDKGWLWSDLASGFTKNTPPASWNNGPGGFGMTVTREGTGRYLVDLSAGHSAGTLAALVSAFGSSAYCSLLDHDPAGVRVGCTRAGQPADSQFSLQILRTRRTQHRWDLLSSLNITPTFDVGYGVACGVVAINSKQVVCMTPVDSGVVDGFKFAGGGSTGELPVGAISVAVENISASFTRILILTSDGILREAAGTLTQPWFTNNNFTGLVTVAQPVMDVTNARVSLRKIVVLRSDTFNSNSNQVLALTTGGAVLELAGGRFGSKWKATTMPLPAGVTIKDISHGNTDLYLVATDGRTFRSRRGAAAAVQLPAIFLGLKPVAMGGQFVITNAAADAGGFIPCSEPKDAQGNYNCPNNNRFTYVSVTDLWQTLLDQAPLPLQNDRSLIPSGDPNFPRGLGNPMANEKTFQPGIVDGRLFDGDIGAVLWAFHVFSRQYHWF
jgi:hypothetical protein